MLQTIPPMASARQVRDEIMKMTIIVNSDPAQKEIYELGVKTKELTETNIGLSKSIKEVESARRKEEVAINNYADKIDKLKTKLNGDKAAASEQIKSLTALQRQYDSTSKEYESYQQKIDAVRSKSLANSKSLESSINSLVAKQSKLVESYDKNSASAKKLTTDLNANKAAITESKNKVAELTSSLDINQMTMAQLRKEAALLKANLLNMVPGSKGAIELQTQLDKVNGRISSVSGGAKGASASFRDLADKFNHYSGIVTVAAGVLVGFGLTIQNIIDRNNKLVDAQTAVSKTVNMTKAEVEELTRSFTDFDTRTSKIDLLKIAEIGGRLGIGKADIKAFVQEVDKANVALGDGFAGGAEAVTNTLGKLKGLYSETKDLNMATAINEIGSAMNELGANGAATEQNIGDFALRIGSLPEKLKPSIAESLALGAAFEESGIDAERAASGYTSFITTAAKETDKFAKVMNMSQKEVDDLINKDPMEFFLKFAEGAKGMGTTELSQMLEYLKLNDQYVIKTMGAASENTDRFRNSIELSNKSLSEATSLQKEFDKVNNNSAAIFEKVQKKLAGIFTSDTVAKGLNWLIESFGLLIGVSVKSEEKMTGFGSAMIFIGRVVMIVVASMTSVSLAFALYNNLIKDSIIKNIALEAISKARAVTTQTATTFQNLYNLSVAGGAKVIGSFTSFLGLSTTATKMQTVAQERLNMVTKANPFGAVLAVVTLLVTAYMTWKSYADSAAKAQKNLNDLTKEAATNASQEVGALDQAYRKLTDKNVAENERIALLKKLQVEYPQYFKNLTTEDFLVGKAKNSYLGLRDAIIASSQAKAAQSEIDKINAKYLEDELEIKERMKQAVVDSKTLGAAYQSNISTSGAAITTVTSQEDNREIAKRRFKLETENLKKLYIERNKALDPYINYIDKANKRSALLNNKAPGTDATSNYSIPGDTTDGKSTKAASDRAKKLADKRKEEHDKEMLQIAKNGEEAARLEAQIALDITDAKIDAMQEGLDKELAEINIQELRRIEAIDKQKIGDAEINDLQKKIAKASASDKKYYEALLAQWIKNNEQLEREKEAAGKIFEMKRETARYKEETRKIGKIDKDFDTEIGHLKRAQNDELASYESFAALKEGLKGRMDEEERRQISSYAEGKEALNKIYQKKELDLQIQHMQAMVDMWQALDLSILTPEQQEQVLKYIDDYKNKISEFNAVVAGQDIEEKGGKKKKRGSNNSADILGMSPESWKELYDNMEAGTATVTDIIGAASTAMQSAMGAYFNFVEANEKRQLATYQRNTNAKKAALKKQLLDGYINQETYKKLTLQADQDLEKKKAELEMKAAKRERAMQIAQAISGTAIAVINALSTKPFLPLGLAMASVAGVMGAIQIGTILSTPLPSADGFEMGYGTEYPIERSQDGKRFNVKRRPLESGLVDRPTHFIAGERNKVEMVIDNPTWTSYPEELKRAIYSANARAKGYEGGLNIGTKTKSTDDQTMMMLVSTVSRMTTTLDNLQKYGIEAKIAKNARNGKEVDEMRQQYLDLNNKNKH